MTLQGLKKAATNKSISDKKFFKILLGYLNDQETRDRKSKKNLTSINSPDFIKWEAEMSTLRELLFKLRPAVMEMLRRDLIKEHKHCCGPKGKK